MTLTVTTAEFELAHLLITAHAWYGDTIGGSFRLASELAQHAAQCGHRVTYVCCNTTRQRPAREDVDGVTIRRYDPPAQAATGLGRLRYHVAETAGLVRGISAEQPVDALSGHSPLQFLGAAKGLRGRSAFKTFVVHSPFDDELRSNSNATLPSLTQRLACGAAWWVDRQDVRLADCVQTDSQYTLDVMTRKHGPTVQRKGIVAPGWVDTKQFQPVTDRRQTRRELGGAWDTDLPVFFTLRRLETRMGLDTLVQACAKLFAEGVEFRTLIGGSGSLKDALRQMIDDAGLQDRVFLLGRLAEEQLPDAYAAADCFVLPTRALECFGLIVLEAFAAETPVIASRAAAIPEIAARQGEAWMFEPGDVEALAARMGRFLSGELQFTANLRSIAMEFDRQNVLRRWMDILLRRGSQVELAR